MITYVKVGNIFIWGTPIRGLYWKESPDDRVKVQHDGDEVGATILVRSLGVASVRNASYKDVYSLFVSEMRPVLSEILKAKALGEEPEYISIKKRSPSFKFKLLGSPEEAYKAFVSGDYRLILRKRGDSYKHKLAYIKALLLAAQNPFLAPPEEELIKVNELLDEIRDPLLQEFYKNIRDFAKGSGSTKKIQTFVEKNKIDIIKEIKDAETAALRAYEVGDPEVAEQILKYASGIRKIMAKMTLIKNGEGSIAEAFNLMTSEDPNEVVLGFLMLTERSEDIDPEERDQVLANIHSLIDARIHALRNKDLSLPSHLARSPIRYKDNLLAQYVLQVKESKEVLERLLKTFLIYSQSFPIELGASILHDISIPYLLAGGDESLVVKLYKSLPEATTIAPSDRLALLPLFYAVVDKDPDLKYPLERLLIRAREKKELRDVYVALKKLIEINGGVIKKLLERRREETINELSMIVESLSA